MEEDNNALFHWPSTWKWHHKNNNDHGGSYFQNQRSHITGDNNNTNSNQSANVSQGLGLRIKIKGPSPPNNNSNNAQSFLCHICNQGFTSAKSLGGHMRMHSFSNKQDHKVRNREVSSSVEKPSCYLCGKTFSSDKSLFGHMRVHPESVRKGTETPTSFDSSESLWGRSPTGKRSLRRDKGLEQGFEVDSQMQEAAYTLMLMANGNLGDEVKHASDHADLVPPSTKKRRIQEKSLAMVGNEKGSFQSNFGDSDGRNNYKFGSNLPAPDQLQHHYGNHTPVQVDGIKATAVEEYDQGQICNKTFSVIGQANRAKTQSKEKGHNGFQIFIGHYDQPSTLDKGKGIQPEVVISSCVMASPNLGL